MALNQDASWIKRATNGSNLKRKFCNIINS